MLRSTCVALLRGVVSLSLDPLNLAHPLSQSEAFWHLSGSPSVPLLTWDATHGEVLSALQALETWQKTLTHRVGALGRGADDNLRQLRSVALSCGAEGALALQAGVERFSKGIDAVFKGTLTEEDQYWLQDAPGFLLAQLKDLGFACSTELTNISLSLNWPLKSGTRLVGSVNIELSLSPYRPDSGLAVAA